MSPAASECELILEPDWLPCRDESIGSTRYLISRYIETHRDRDWFLALATRMEVYDSLQSRALTMFYIFVRRFMPAGHHYGFDHIAGEEVMRHLLSSIERFSIGHKDPTYTLIEQEAYDHTTSVFTSLEIWMKQGKTWEDALKTAKARHRENNDHQVNWKAQGLYSPAGLLATLILAQPKESSLKMIVSRLEIDWMLCPQGELNVTSGYWQGLNTGNIHTAFVLENRGAIESRLLADYTPLFHNFVECRGNIKPFLQPWAHDISLSHGRGLEDVHTVDPLNLPNEGITELTCEINNGSATIAAQLNYFEDEPITAKLAIGQKKTLRNVNNIEINPSTGEKGASSKRQGEALGGRAGKCLKLATISNLEENLTELQARWETRMQDHRSRLDSL